ncbi:HAD-IIIA family hydrolase [Candidatus Pelagibacter sp. HIMB1746]|uniref:HAD-IIIA family hydrolase n=1 Tax=Candidatus Pelagibacter sp. HIMB1746 TaxID=3413370 RepID=UPI003F856F09
MENNKAFFFDRDGVLNKAVIKNKKPYPPKNLEELIIDEDAFEIIKFLKKKKFKIFVFTNQPDVAKKKIKKKEVIKINNFISKKLLIDELFVCYCSTDECFRRKPNPGMIFDAKKKWNINLKESYVVGDRYKDIEAGINAGTKTIYINNNYNEKKPKNFNHLIKTLKDIKKIIRS